MKLDKINLVSFIFNKRFLVLILALVLSFLVVYNFGFADIPNDSGGVCSAPGGCYDVSQSCESGNKVKVDVQLQSYSGGRTGELSYYGMLYASDAASHAGTGATFIIGSASTTITLQESLGRIVQNTLYYFVPGAYDKNGQLIAYWGDRGNVGTFKTRVCSNPVANAGPDQTVNEGSAVALDGSGSSDPDGDSLTYLWSIPAGVTLFDLQMSSSDLIKPKPTFTAPFVTADTNYTFTLVVNDGKADSSSDSVVITVKNLYALTVTKAGTGSGTVTSSPAGINCGSDCSESYTYNTSVTLTAAVSVGSTFAGWSGNCSGTATTCSLTMSAAKSVTATFNMNLPSANVTCQKNGIAVSDADCWGFVGKDILTLVNNSSNYDSCLWSNAFNSISCANQTPSLGRGSYTSNLTVSNGGGSNSDSISFSYLRDIQASFQCSLDNATWRVCGDITTEVKKTIYLKDFSQPSEKPFGADGTITIRSWVLTSKPSGSLTANPAPDGGANPSFIPDVSGDYTVQLNVTDSNTRAATVSQTIEVGPHIKWREIIPR